MSTKSMAALGVGVLVALLLSAAAGGQELPVLEAGRYRAWLESPGGDLPFILHLQRGGDGFTAAIENGEERIPIPVTRVQAGTVTFDMEHYDSKIVAQVVPGGRAMRGEWTKRISTDELCRMGFFAERSNAPRFLPLRRTGPHEAVRELNENWRVQFSSSEDPAVGRFRKTAAGEIAGTFLTTTGDYRYLAGAWQEGRLRLSCFDGAHAFLFDATLTPGGTLAGEFWSRDRWNEQWIAEPDPEAALPDAFTLTKWNEGVSLDDLTFRGLDGAQHSLSDPRFAGRAIVLQLFGSWCPNCHDASTYLADLHRRYGPQGLSVVGLAFELTDDFERNAEMVRRYARRHEVSYPLLLAGPSDKAKATVAFKALDRVRSYPTTVFLHGDGRIRAIHTGFSGPATGLDHQRLRASFEAIIEELIAE